MVSSIVAFIAGELLTALAIAFVFRTSLPIQIYELLVREIADRFGFDVNRVKQVNDAAMLILSESGMEAVSNEKQLRTKLDKVLK